MRSAPQPNVTNLPPAAMESMRQPKRERTSGGLAGWFGGGKSRASTDGVDATLPKHLELQGLEIARLGQLVRTLAGEGKYPEALDAARQRLTIIAEAEGTLGQNRLPAQLPKTDHLALRRSCQEQ